MYERSYEKEKAMKQLLNWDENTGICHQPRRQCAQCLVVCGVCSHGAKCLRWELWFWGSSSLFGACRVESESGWVTLTFPSIKWNSMMTLWVSRVK